MNEFQKIVKERFTNVVGGLIKHGHKEEWAIKKGFIDTRNEILNKTSHLHPDIPFKKRIDFILETPGNRFFCTACNKPLKDTGRLFCSFKCAANDPNQKADRKATCEKKYGGSSFPASKIGKEIIAKSLMENHGVTNVFQMESTKAKIVKTSLERHGVKHPTQSKMSREKINATVRKKLYEDLISGKRAPFIIPNFSWDHFKKINLNTTRLDWKCSRCTMNFDARMDDGLIPQCPKCDQTHYRGIENEISDFLTENEINFSRNNRKMISPKELDFYIPDQNLAIEMNGIYWHSESMGGNKDTHLNKANRCKERGIHLIQIFESEWNEKKDIIKSIILAKLGKFDRRIFARKCKVITIDSKVKNEFLEENHRQGKDNSSHHLGLFFEDALVSVMTFGRRKITGADASMELIRFANKKGYSIVGGASKLFKHFLDKYWNGESIVSYADRRFSNESSFYPKLGFTLERTSPPNYWYIVKRKLVHRVSFQKHKLPDILENFDSELSEWMNMQNNGYSRIWDCGNLVYKFSK